MDPNQTTPQDGSTTPVDQGQTPPATDPQSGGYSTDPQQQSPTTPDGGVTSTDGGVTSTDAPAYGTSTDTTGYGTATTGSDSSPYTSTTPSFLGVPVDTLMVVGPIFMIGILLAAWLAGRKDHTEQLARLDKQRKRQEARDAEKPEAAESIFKVDNQNFLGKLLSEAGLEAQYDKMKQNWIMAVIGTSVVIGAICFVYAPALAPFAFLFGPGLGSFGFIQYVKFQGNQRQRRLTAQLPQVLESMVSTLRAGSPVIECFKLLSETSPEPIRSEFKRALVSLQLGKPFRDVIADMGTRIRTQDFKLLAQAIFISQDVGANLADVVATIAEAIRERFRLRDFLASLTAQGKMTALFIGGLPYFITAMTYMITPGYIVPFLNHPIARMIFIALIIWEAIGAWILIKMTTFEV